MTERITMFDEGLQSCCGARFLAKFGNCADYRGTWVADKWDGKEGNEALKKELEHKTKTWGGQAFLVAVLNNEQWGKDRKYIHRCRI